MSVVTTSLPSVGMYGELLRVTPAELDRAIADPRWAMRFADRISATATGFDDDEYFIEDDDGLPGAPGNADGDDPDSDDPDGDEPGADIDEAEARRRYLSTDKAWDAIRHLLWHAGFPVNIVHGEHPFGGEDADWGYGPPAYLTAAEVAVASAALGALPFEKLVAGVTAEDLGAAGIYPRIWADTDNMDWIRGWYEPVPTFFAAAAEAGDCMLLWLS